MRSLKYIKSAFIIAICAVVLTTSNISTDKVTAQPTTVQTAVAV